MKTCARVFKICLAVFLFATPQVSARDVLPLPGTALMTVNKGAER